METVEPPPKPRRKRRYHKKKKWRNPSVRAPKEPHSAELLYLRRHLRMTQGDLCKAIQIGRRTLSRWEKDPTHPEWVKPPLSVILLLRLWNRYPSAIPVSRRHRPRFHALEKFLGPTQRAEPALASVLAEPGE